MLPLLTRRLRLRALTAGDLHALAALWMDPLVSVWIGEHTREDVEEELHLHIAHQASHGWSLWAVEDRSSGRLIGDCGLQPLELKGPDVELGYELLPAVWGHGLATEAAMASLRAAFGPLGMERVVATVKAENAASVRVLEKAGMRLVGPRMAYEEPMLLYDITRAAGAEH